MALFNYKEVPVVIVGGGPSSLILSYILHGHVPYYTGGHRDALLDSKLRKLPNLLHITPDIWSHFEGDLHYASSALPVNTLLDTLIRPNADTQLSLKSFVQWKYQPELAVPHIVYVKEQQCGGVWVSVPQAEHDETGTLSYSEMLSLPGFTFEDHYVSLYGRKLQELQRPSKSDAASYFAAYPAAVGIASSFRMGCSVSKVSRLANKFLIQPFNMSCKYLILATGTFDHNIAPPALLLPLSVMNVKDLPVLVIGSGYSAADAIVSIPPHRSIIHIYRWNPEKKASPLQGCHHQAYPEYAGIYRLMRNAASGDRKQSSGRGRKRSKSFLSQRDWEMSYEALPNAHIEEVNSATRGAKLKIRLQNGQFQERNVGALDYFVGRRGSLSYLDENLQSEILHHSWRIKDPKSWDNITSKTFRSEAEVDSEIAPSVFVIGSLTGDTLIRHAFGSCIQTASHVILRSQRANEKLKEGVTKGCLKRPLCGKGNKSDDGIRIES